MNHFTVSMFKSGIRFAAGATLMGGNFWWAGILLILAEGLGVVEEFVDQRIEGESK
jgi:hypothetical protein